MVRPVARASAKPLGHDKAVGAAEVPERPAHHEAAAIAATAASAAAAAARSTAATPSATASAEAAVPNVWRRQVGLLMQRSGVSGDLEFLGL